MLKQGIKKVVLSSRCKLSALRGENAPDSYFTRYDLMTHLTQNVPKVPWKGLTSLTKPSGRCVASVNETQHSNQKARKEYSQ
jgi:hypothetical protein